MTDIKRALLLVNRHARRGQEDLSQAINQLQAFGLDLIEPNTVDLHSLTDTIQQHRDQVDLVIVGGGDGTLNAAVEGLVKTKLPLGILPLGTANDLARTLGIPTTIEDACEVIAYGRLQPIDLGWVNGKHFFNVASLGLSVNITQQLSREVKRRWGVFAYAIAAVRVLTKSVPFTAEIRMSGKVHRVRTVQIAIGNGRYYGGGLTVAADAAIDDQRLDLYSLEIRHWWQMIPLLPAMRSGTHASWSFVNTMRGQEIEVHTLRPYAINTDGEITTATPAQFRVIPQAISVLVPQPALP
ncbi:lipid kinase [Leptolyngbya sp. FACHB-36]|uniref:lipid kinase n=1 Tax=Leptolyngbya sp. FACHB-36 TaxID=2692808 RepID=UPI00168145E8|nr:lipid kinase [Leptolyngbya sp. FACHB-36]MBD2022427.1 lipid kinase [Leptolyngbya sp. FACHB-36]